MSTDDPDTDTDADDLAERFPHVAELEQALEEADVDVDDIDVDDIAQRTGATRRDVLTGSAGLLGLGALLTGGSGTASAGDDQVGSIGTDNNRLDAEIEDLDLTDQSSVPAGPGSGQVRMYFRDGTPYYLPAGGSETQLGGGGGIFEDTNSDGVYEQTTGDGIETGLVNVDVLNSSRWVDASLASDSDLNTALSNHDDVFLYGGTLILSSTSIVIPANTTLHFVHADIQVDGAVSKADGTLNTQQDNTGTRTFDMMIDARGNDGAELITEAGRTVLDANIGGTTDRAHVMAADASNIRIEGPIETRGGRAMWVWDVDDSSFAKGYHDHANDSNNQGSAILNVEGAQNCEFETFHCVGDPAASPNINESVDFNQACQECQVTNITGIDIDENALDVTNSPNTQASQVYAKNVQSVEAGAVNISADAGTSGVLTSRSASDMDGCTFDSITLEQPSPDTSPAVRLYHRDDFQIRNLSIEVTAEKTKAFEYEEQNITQNNLLNGFRLTAESTQSNGRGVEFSPSVAFDGAVIHAQVYQPSGIGVDVNGSVNASEIVAIVRGGGSDGLRTACSNGAHKAVAVSCSGDGLRVASGKRNHFSVSSTQNGGYGINEDGSVDNKYDGAVQGNSSGETSNISSGSIVDVV